MSSASATKRAGRKVGTPATQRMRKLECEAGEGCGAIVYASRAQIRRGLYGCACGGRLIPMDPDDAALVLEPGELDAHPAVMEYRRALSSVMHGQASHGIRGRQLRPAEAVALERVEQDRRAAARARRLAAIQPAAPAADPIPF